MVTIPERTLALVEAAVPIGPPGLSSGKVAERTRDYAATTVRHSLRALVAAGRVRFDGEDTNRSYWRPRQTS